MTAVPIATNPYAETFDAYRDAGWSPLPLPYREKFPPPRGYTGRNAAKPSYADCHAWSEDGLRNICLHLRTGFIGLDVDAYGGKPGYETLQSLIAELGPLPPTYLSTSRGDGMSGIRLYRVPTGVEFITALPGIEVVQEAHRYMVVWPSVHPEGGVYEWIDERTGERLDTPPRAEDIPELPSAWVAHLTRTTPAGMKADIGDVEVAGLISQMPTGRPCGCVIDSASKARAEAAEGKSRHDAYLGAVLSVLSRGRDGCPGARDMVNALAADFVHDIADRLPTADAALEFRGMVLGALRLLASTPQGDRCWQEQIAATEEWVASLPPDPMQAAVDVIAERIAATASTPTSATPAGLEDSAEGEAADAAAIDAGLEDSAIAREAARHLIDLRAREVAREEFARLKVSGRTLPTIIGAAEFLAADDEPTLYRVDDLWPLHGRVLLVAQAKTGKTTLVVANLLHQLLRQGCGFLGRYNVQPVEDGRTVVYMNVEVGAITLRHWLRRTGVAFDNRLQILNLRGQASALNLSSAAGRSHWAGVLRGLRAEVVILDPVAPVLAAHGLDENSNTDVATFWSWWGEMLTEAGVTDDLVVHHAGHAGERSRGASRLLDEPDAIWTLTKSGGEDGKRYIEAIGRDVDLSRHELLPPTSTGHIEIGDAKRPADRRRAQMSAEQGLKAKIDGTAPRLLFSYSQAKRCIGGDAADRDERGSEWLDGLASAGLITIVPGASEGQRLVGAGANYHLLGVDDE